ncbi:MAG: RNA 3'-terminal phosphate cyclase [Nitrospirota bacterium]
MNYLTIDGNYGEGGGQILRSALSFSIIFSTPVEIISIRKGRKKGGLQPQHLTCVNACRDISDAHVEGNEIGSTLLRFNPKVVKSGNFTFDVAEKKGSAGSTSLVLQTLIPSLIHNSKLNSLTVMGGTHVPWSPAFHYLKEVFVPVIGKMGCHINLSIDKWGWYPIGGGVVHAEIRPSAGLKGIKIENRGRLLRIYGMSAVSNLPYEIAERQRAEGLKNLKALGVDVDIELVTAPSPGKGTFFFVVAEYEGSSAGFSSLGALGKPAEDVAREACRDLLEYHRTNGAVEPHLADQLIPYIAIADGPSSFTTTKITRHLLTNIWTVKHFIDTDIRVTGKEGEEGKVFKY